MSLPTDHTYIRFEERFAPPPEDVFAFLANHDNFVGMFAPRWLPMVLRRAGHCETPDAADGLGTIRKIGLTPFGPFFLHEQIVAYEPPSRLSYKALDPLFRFHIGVVELTPTDEGGTHLIYDIEFRTFSRLFDKVLAEVLTFGWRLGVRRNGKQLGWCK